MSRPLLNSVPSCGSRCRREEPMLIELTSPLVIRTVQNPSIHSSETGESRVYIVDDDESTRTSLCSLFRSVGLQVSAFDTTEGFLTARRAEVPGCLVLDVRLRGESGLAFQQHALKLDISIPIIFMTGHGDIAMTVTAMKAGALDFLAKPFRDQDMLDAVSGALAADAQRLEKLRAERGVHENYKLLTPREREVLTYVIAGLLNKQIAARMDVSEITAKIHRGCAMKKMEARSVADLVRKAQILGVSPSST
jgi:FixJ family two-component response regulator